MCVDVGSKMALLPKRGGVRRHIALLAANIMRHVRLGAASGRRSSVTGPQT
jgi:hypothetical protein